MAIRLIDQPSSRLGSLTSLLDQVVAGLTGSFVPAPGRTGTIASPLGLLVANFVGLFSESTDRTGTIGITLGGVGATVSGAFTSPSNIWQPIASPPIFTFGTPGSWSFDPYDPPTAQFYQLASGSAALPAGVSLNSAQKTLDYSGAGAVGTIAGVILEDIPSAEADWQSRIAGVGVVWYHDFRSDAEVNAFRWTPGYAGGNDPLAVGSALAPNCRRITTDGVTGACLEILRPVGANEPSLWWRPFSPMNTGSGKPVNDPGANGTIPVQTWAATDGGSQLSNWQRGWYGHPNYQQSPFFDGHDWYLQIRVKADPRRISGGNQNNTVGKLVWITTAEGAQSLSAAEHVTWSYGDGGNQGPTLRNYVRLYVLGVNGIGAFDPLDQEEPGTRIQPGSDVAADWYFSGGWDTLLYHHRPGVINTATGVNSFLLEIWAARQGETGYTKIWTQEFGIGGYELRNGLQALILSAYNNNNVFAQPFWHRFCQVIFSRNFIPCPQV